MHVIEHTPADGGYQRVLALKDFSRPEEGGPIFTGPVLTLLAEAEENILVPGSPTIASLRDPRKRSDIFPRGSLVQVVSRNAGDAVNHASLIFHHHCYNPLISAWYDRLRPTFFAVVG